MLLEFLDPHKEGKIHFIFMKMSFTYHSIYRGNPLDNMVAGMGKKSKLSVLDKSKLDWNKFKTTTGTSEELAHHKKNG